MTIEFGFEYDVEDMPSKINSLMKEIKSKHPNFQWILLIDELIALTKDDYTNLHTIDDVDFLIGVSPNSKAFGVVQVLVVSLPTDNRIIAKREVPKNNQKIFGVVNF